jgi:hypothetical protein
MPILKPEIQAALRTSGLLSHENQTLEESLNSSGLTLDSTLSTISQIQEFSGNESARLRAAELSLKARGFLREQAPTIPSITFIIQDSHAPKGVNPILIPRELLLESEDVSTK